MFQTRKTIGHEILNQQMKLLTDSRHITDPDMEDANEETNIVESDEEIDEI